MKLQKSCGKQQQQDSAIIQYMTVSGHPQQQLQFISISLPFSHNFQLKIKRNILNFICDEVSGKNQ